MKETFVNLHIHSTRSDGKYSPSEICDLCVQNDLRIISLTDHNYTEDVSSLRQQYPQLQIIQGCEISAIYTDKGGKETEIHILGLGVDPSSAALQAVLQHNQPDRSAYIGEILSKLRNIGLDVPDYQTLCAMHPEKRYCGRSVVAKYLWDRGYTSSLEDSFQKYLNKNGLCYSPPPVKFVSVEAAISAVLEAGGIASLCHLFVYGLSDSENEAMVKQFKELAGNKGALETMYSRFNEEQRNSLSEIAARYALLHSCGSDFHGQSDQDILNPRFSYADCAPLLSALGY